MANEAHVDMGGDGQFESWTVADANAIAKGTFMVISEAATKTAVAHSAADERFIGVASEQKEALDGKTKMSIQVKGEIDANASTTIDEGDFVSLSATANQVQPIAGTVCDKFLYQLVGVSYEAGTAFLRIKLGLRY